MFIIAYLLVILSETSKNTYNYILTKLNIKYLLIEKIYNSVIHLKLWY